MKRSALIFALGLAVASIGLKLWNPQLPENFGIYYALALFCGCFLRGPVAWALPVATLLISDVAGQVLDDYLLGVYSPLAMGLNYVALTAMTCTGALLRLNNSLLMVAFGSVGGAIAFFLISNLGAFMDSRMGYEPTLAGLLRCYELAIPFARGTFSSSVLFSLAAFAGYRWWLASSVVASTETATEKSIAN